MDHVNATVTEYKGEAYTVKSADGKTVYFSTEYDRDENYKETVNGVTFTYSREEENRNAQTGVTNMSHTVKGNGLTLNLSAATDALGRRQAAFAGLEGSKTGVATSLTYETYDGNKTGERVSEYKTAVKAQSGFDSAATYGYTYDANGNIKTVTKNGTLVSSYDYDEAGQLTKEMNSGVVTTYQYDKGGNIRTKTQNGTVIPYGYEDANWKDKLTSYGGNAIPYAANGNPLYYDGWLLRWTAGRQLESMTKGETVIVYGYDDEGLRTSKTVTANGTVTKTSYVWGEKKLLGVTTENNAVRLIYQNDVPVGFIQNGSESYFYLKNLQGDVTGIVDKTGQTVVSYAYDAWGKLLSQTGDQAVAKMNPITYRGYNFDTETGLYYLQSRYYNPEWGRFLNADNTFGKISEIHGFNLFSYCKNNPIAHADSNGNFATEILAGLGFVALFFLMMGMVFIFSILSVYMTTEFQTSFKELVNALDKVSGRRIQNAIAMVAAFVIWLQYLEPGHAEKVSDQQFLEDAKNRPEPLPPDQGGKGTPTETRLLYHKDKIRVEVEVFKDRPGNVHIHIDKVKYWYNVKSGNFRMDNINGPKAPKSVQKYLKDKKILRALRKGLEMMGY